MYIHFLYMNKKKSVRSISNKGDTLILITHPNNQAIFTTPQFFTKFQNLVSPKTKQKM